MKSIRRYQLVALLLGTILIVVVATTMHHLAVRRSLIREFDSALMAKAASLSALLEYEPPYFEFNFSESAMPQYAPGPDAEYFQVWIAGEVFARSRSLGEADLPDHSGPANRPRGRDIALPDGRRGRTVGLASPVKAEDVAFGPRNGRPTAVVVVARSREQLQSTLASVAILSIVEGGLIFVGVSILVVVTIGRAMAEVERLAAQVDAIDSATLHHRVTDADMPDELKPIAGGLNRLLARIEEAFRRERRVNANIAHELRTPVAELRTATDVARKWSDDPALAKRTLTTAAEIAEHMEHIVTSLLRLARIQSGQLALCPVPVDCSRLLLDCWDDVVRRAEAKSIQATIDVMPGLVVSSDRDGLNLILQNLLSNAVAHCPNHGWIRCTAGSDATTVRVEIANENGTLRPEDQARLTEAFWSGSTSASGSDHAGLGLTLVHAMAELLDVDVVFGLDENDFRATLVVPRESSSHPHNGRIEQRLSSGLSAPVV